eukprot:2314852-Prorocentrum_lima.AAC.1
MGTLAELNDPVFSRKKHELMVYYVKRHVHLQRPLSNMSWSSEFAIDWSCSGVFSLAVKDD